VKYTAESNREVADTFATPSSQFRELQEFSVGASKSMISSAFTG